MFWYVLGILFLMGCSCFFSGSEAAVFALDRVKATELARKGRGPLALVYRRLPVFLSTVLMLNFLANTGMSVLTAVLAMKNGLSIPLLGVILTVMILVFAEIIPKIIAVRFNETLIHVAAWPFAGFMVLFRPVTATLTGGCRLLQGMLPWKPLPIFTEGELKTVITEAAAGGMLREREGRILQNIIDFRQRKVSAFMTPRTDIAFVPVDTPDREVRRLARLSRFARLPVTASEDIQTVMGCVSVKEVMLDHPMDLRKSLRPVYYAPESMVAGRLFQILREREIQQAMVVDEYGQVAGLVTVHDLIEELMGDISDEYTGDAAWVAREKENGWVVNATQDVAAINRVLPLDLPLDEGRTLGGFLFHRAGHLPKRHERLHWAGWTFKVQVIRRKRIVQVSVTREAAS